MHISPPENLYLNRFFDGVDSAITQELASGRVAYEEFLTPTLGRLLDEASPFQALLPYSLQELNSDLSKCGSGNRVAIQFETHEHSKSYSGSVSHADLGIIVRFEHSDSHPPLEKGVLVESKRLYPLRSKYTLNSRYEGFSKDQYLALKSVASGYKTTDIYYFLYNPQLSAFDEAAAIVLRARENQLTRATGSAAVVFGDERISWNSYWWSLPGVEADADSYRQKFQEYTAHRPGLRVISLSTLARLIEKEKRIITQFSLAQCYEVAREQWWWHPGRSDVSFVTFSRFVVDLLLACICGSKDDHFIGVVAGKVSDSPPPNTPTVLTKHTLRITLESTLPHVE